MENLFIYLDESIERGPKCSWFFGGLLVQAKHHAAVVQRLTLAKERCGITGELKWTNVTWQFSERYIEFLREVFRLMDEGLVRIRIKFTPNRNLPQNLAPYYASNGYSLLYYTFIRGGFGLSHGSFDFSDTRVSLRFDELPNGRKKREAFWEYLTKMQIDNVHGHNVFIDRNQISELRSREHIVLQALDLMLGYQACHLNGGLLVRPEEKTRLWARTQVGRFISKELEKRFPRFDPARPTVFKPEEYWSTPYNHWPFRPDLESLRVKERRFAVG